MVGDLSMAEEIAKETARARLSLAAAYAHGPLRIIAPHRRSHATQK